MPKWLKVCLRVAVAVVYMNIGYLFAYSLDSTASQTAFSDSFYKTVDFMGIVGKAGGLESGIDYFIFYVIFGFFWPFYLFLIWSGNFAVLLWQVLVWLVAGGFWKWLGLLK